MGSGWTRNGFVYLLILVAAAALFFSLFPQQKQPDMATASQVAQWIQENKVASVDVDGETVTVETKDGQTYSTTKDANASFNELMMGLGVTPEQLGDPIFRSQSNHRRNWVVGSVSWPAFCRCCSLVVSSSS